MLRNTHIALIVVALLIALPASAALAQQTFSSTPGTSIPDGPNDGIQDSIVVSGGPTSILSLVATIDITHTWDSDLSVWLLPPGVNWPGAINASQRDAAIVAGAIELFANIGGSGANFTNAAFTAPGDANDPGTTLIPDDEAQAPFTGTWYPRDVAALNALYGTDSNGTWRLVMYDDVAADTGVLNSWSLQIVHDTSADGGAGAGAGEVAGESVDIGHGCAAGTTGSPVAGLALIALLLALVALRRRA